MKTAPQPDLKPCRTLPISLFIGLVLGLQLNATFNLVCRRQVLAWFPQLENYCAPALWPFVDYTMYVVTYKENDQIEKPYIFGTLDDSSEVAILPEDIGVKPHIFFRMFLGISAGNPERIQQLVDMYYENTQQTLVGIRLEKDVYRLTPDGLTYLSRNVVRHIDTQNIRE